MEGRMSRQDDIKRLIVNHNRHLQILEEQKAQYGNLACPPHILLEIENQKAEIAQLEVELIERQDEVGMVSKSRLNDANIRLQNVGAVKSTIGSLTRLWWVPIVVGLIGLIGVIILLVINNKASTSNRGAEVTLFLENWENSPANQSAGSNNPNLQLNGQENVLVLNEYDESGGYIPDSPSDLTLTYTYEREGDKVLIKPEMPYLTRLSQGGPITGIDYWWSPFKWQFPKLSVKIINNTDNTLFLTEANIDINSSEINTEPVLIIEENFYNVGNFDVINEGWGKVVNPTFDFGITSTDSCEKDQTLEADKISIHKETFLEETRVSIIDYVPSDLLGHPSVCVFGEIYYTNQSQEERTIKFKTRVSLIEPGADLPQPPNYLYDVFLEAGKSNYSMSLPISQEIKPGEVDHFLVRVATDKSAQFNLAFSFRAVGGIELPANEVFLDIFVPRSQEHFVQASH